MNDHRLVSPSREPVSIGQALAIGLMQIGQHELAETALMGKPAQDPLPILDQQALQSGQTKLLLEFETGRRLHKKSRATK
jgi:hypothetical protein